MRTLGNFFAPKAASTTTVTTSEATTTITAEATTTTAEATTTTTTADATTTITPNLAMTDVLGSRDANATDDDVLPISNIGGQFPCKENRLL